MRKFRGSALDVFGMTAERRRERQLRDDYMQLLERLVGELRAANHAVAVELAEVPERIRGFGHVKEQHVTRAKQIEAELLAKFANPQAVTREKKAAVTA